MTLVLEVEFLSGISFATVGPDGDGTEWPPQPDRIFSALVASWAARGEREDEAEALKWLEALPVPTIHASLAEPRTAPTVFVPPNDSRSDKQKHAKAVLPAMRNRQARRFPAARPANPVVSLLWDVTEFEQKPIEALQRLASDTAYIGHSASLTRCRFLCAGGNVVMDDAESPRRTVYTGRFEELCRDFRAGRRPLPGAPVQAKRTSIAFRAQSVFDSRWLLLDHVGGDMPDVRASAIVAKAIRDSILSGYRQIGSGTAVPEVVSGHDSKSRPTSLPHLSILPLSFVGFPHADGHVVGFALVPPRDEPILEEEIFRKALRKIAPIDERRGRRVLTVKTREGTQSRQTFSINLSPTFEPPPGRRSLDPSLYLGPGRTWASVTPIVLDRHLKREGQARQEEAAQQIAAACRNIGLPEPATVVVDKHSAFEGAVSAYPSSSSPPWTRWRLPASLASRQLTHAVVEFSQPLAGPVVLGAGRFVGLGLCRPIRRERA